MILVHELGHLIVAKRVGITVHTFAIGFGPRLWAVTRGETTYALNLLPIGGYVKIGGGGLDPPQPPGGSPRPFPAENGGGRPAGGFPGPPRDFVLAGLV